MVKLEWLDSFSIGVKEIDDDHKQILHIMRNVKEAVEQRDLALCSTLLDDLINLGKEHFLREEKYLARVSYPYIEEHILYHQDLLLKVKALRAVCDGTSGRDDLEVCFNRMAEFLIDDIIAGDLQFKSYLQSRGLVK